MALIPRIFWTFLMNILVRNISQLLTMIPAAAGSNEAERRLGIIGNAAVLIENGLITWTGPDSEADEQVGNSGSCNVVDAYGCVVMPGIIDPHTHLIFAGHREHEFAARLAGATYEEILAAGGGIHSTVKATRSASEEELFELGTKRLDFCIDHGVTTVEVKSGYGLETTTEIKMLETAARLNREHAVDVVPTFLGAHVMPKEYAADRRGYIDLIGNEMLPEISEKKLAAYCDVFIEEGAYSIEEARAVLEAAAEFGLKPRLHIDQFNDIGGVELAVEFGAASVDHLEALSSQGIEKLAAAGIPAVLLPGATFFLRMKNYAPARDIIDGGVVTVLATDFNPGSCMTAMPFIIMTIACVQMGMTPAETLTAFTVNAARALEKDDRGVIEAGKRADMIILDVENFETIPYHFARNHVAHVIKDGVIVK